MSAAQKGGGGGESTELDLTKPGKLWAKVENEQGTTFHLVLPNAKYTKDALKANPLVDAQDQLMRPWTVAFRDVKDGMAQCDLDASGRAAEIMAKLSERYEKGGARVEKVMALYIAGAREGNRIPDSQVAEVKEFKLITIPSITLKPVLDYMTVQNFKGACCACARKGQKNYHVELSVTGPVEEVEITTTPESQISGGASGKGRATMKVKEGQKYAIHVPVPLKMRMETRQEKRRQPYIHYVRGGWRSAGNADLINATVEREVWDGGNITLRVAGTGNYKGIVKTVNLRAEAWASNWLWKNPPPPLWHNVC